MQNDRVDRRYCQAVVPVGRREDMLFRASSTCVLSRSYSTTANSSTVSAPRGQQFRLHVYTWTVRNSTSGSDNIVTAIQVKVKLEVRTLDIAPLRETSPQKRSGMARVLKGSQFYLHISTPSSTIGMSHTCLCLPSYSWYSFTDPGGMEGWVGSSVDGYVVRQFTCPKAVTHPTTNRAHCRAVALIETNALPLHQTATINTTDVSNIGPWKFCLT